MKNPQVDWQRIGRLLCKAELNEITQTEKELLEEWLAVSPRHRELQRKISDELRKFGVEEFIDAEKAWMRFAATYLRRRSKATAITGILGYAAAAVALIIVFVWSLKLHDTGSQPEIAVNTPETNVMLVLDDGREYQLGAGNEKITIDETVEILAGENSMSCDVFASSKAEPTVHYYTVVVPRYGFYRMTLPDGTSVILNSETDLRYPVPFEEGRREVWLAGEAYFEVAHDKLAPFTIHFPQGQILVLGTSFNINAHRDGLTASATLLEGSVECATGQTSRRLTPGNQAVFDPLTGGIDIRPADIRVATAWTHGNFYFKDKTLGEIIDELSRWYDADVVYAQEELRDQVFTVEISRYETLNKILDMMAKTERIHYKQENRQITLCE